MVDNSMLKQKGMKSSALSWLMFCGYYYVVAVLCCFIMAPDKALVIHEFSHDELTTTFFYFGVLCGLWLWFSGVSKSSIAMDLFLKKHEWSCALKSVINTLFSFSVLIAPLLALHYNQSIKNHLSPLILSLLTAFFLVLVTYTFFSTSRVFKELNHA